MSDPGLQQALAAASAQIAELERRLSETEAAARAAVAGAEAGQAALRARINELSVEVSAKGTGVAAAEARAADLAGKLSTALTAGAAAQADRVALSAKFDALYGEPAGDEGIVRGPQPYITSHDGAAHPTLAVARLHLVAAASGLTPAQARALVEKSEQLIPLIQRAVQGSSTT